MPALCYASGMKEAMGMDRYITGAAIRRLREERKLTQEQLVKLYPEGAAEARFRLGCVKHVYAYCKRHGLYRAKAV